MLKKILTFYLILALCLGIVGCSEQAPATEPSEQESSAQETKPETPTDPPVEETKTITYTYKAEAMQNAECTYYGPNDYVPNSPNPEKVHGKIMVWTQCPNCGEDHIGSHAVDPTQLDFSYGDSVMYSDTDSCWDCSWDKDIDQFMWTIRVTRIPE